MIREKMKFCETNLIDLIKQNMKEDCGIIFIENNRDVFLSYKNLYHKALNTLNSLQKKGIKSGTEMIFQLEDNQEFIIFFWACVLGGIIPVPVSLGNTDGHRSKLLQIWKVLNNPYLLTSREILNKFENASFGDKGDNMLREMKSRIIFTDTISNNHEEGIIHTAKTKDIAFLQFSSGSTGEPKGVKLTHRNLLVNIGDIVSSIKAKETDSTLSWMPLTHDMGLIGFHLAPLAAGINQYIMPTVGFITSPLKWMDKASQYKTTILGSPNFGYKHFLGFLRDKEKDWDLSSISILLNGAEPISAELSNMFFNYMEKWGLKKTAAFPSYGLAEACLAVSFPKIGDKFRGITLDREKLLVGEKVVDITGDEGDGITFVDLGYPVENCSIRICDENNNELLEDTIGHIQIKGENVTSGYYNNPEATEKAITKDGWFKTGDLGFKREGRLIVTGRAKDIIFVNGQNYYPHDIEYIAGEIKGAELGKTVVCGIFNSQLQKEEIMVFVLSKNNIDKFVQLAMEVKKHLNNRTGLDIKQVLPVKNIPKTTSGKVQRYKLKESYEKGAFVEIIEEMEGLVKEALKNREVEVATNELETQLLKIWSKILGINNIGINDSFFELGGNSLKATYIASQINKELGVEIPIKNLFNSPTIKALAMYISTIEKKQYIPIEKVEEADHYPLSSPQKRMYILNKVDNSGLNYNISQVLIIEGELDRERFSVACKTILERHEILRTTFEMVNGEVVQKIHKKVELPLSNFKAEEKDVSNLINQFIKPFDLSSSPLIRMGLIKVADKKHYLILDVHHIIFDGTSMMIFMKELIELYNGVELPPLEIQYKDYSLWQNQLTKSEKIEKQKKFWLQQFSDELPVLNLMGDYPRPAIKSFEGDIVSYDLGKELTEKLNHLCKETGTTLYMILLAAYNVLLHKYTSQEDIVVGSPIAGRPHGDLNGSIGMFINTLAIRNFPSGEKSFNIFLQEVKDMCLKAFENQDYQFEELVDLLNIPRDISRNPLFDVMFVMQNMDLYKKEMKGLTLKGYELKHNISKFDLTMSVMEIGKKIHIELEYSTKIFKRETIERMFKHYKNLLKKIVDHSETKISQLEILTQDERQKLLVEFNNTQVNYPKNRTIHQLFEEQVEKTPDNIALKYEGQQLTYRELNEKTNQLARALKGKGVECNSVVAIMMERSLEMIIGMLGILKAGGAYLPIDPEYPEDRINYILEDSQTEILLTQGHLTDKFSFKGQQTILIDEDLYGGEEKYNLELINKSTDLAYIIYTSGSTGKPKGVMVEHQNVIRLLINDKNLFDFSSKDIWTMFHSFCFDFSVWEMYGALLYGGKLIIVSKLTAQNPAEYLTLLKKEKVTVLNQTPAAFYNLSNEEMKCTDSNAEGIRYIIFGGEALKPKMLKFWREKYNNVKLINMYGITETTVHVTYKEITEEEINTNLSNIGKPIPTLSTYVMDKYLKVVPIGVVGELCVGGDGVTRGYLNKPELTKERFVFNPYVEGEKLYRSGDLVRILPNGDMDYIGRIDHQVKIRGYRIELGEIENKLLRYKDVKEAVVVVKEELDGNKYLCGYIIGNKQLTIADVRKELAKQLPAYMIPQYILELQEMPVTSNGKIDRKRLPDVEGNLTVGSDSEYIAPTNEIERTLVNIWQEVLNIDEIGIYHNFFELGGHSLKAISLVTKIHKKLEVEVPLQVIFKNPTIKAIVEYIRGVEKRGYSSIEPVEKREFYPLSSAQNRLYLQAQLETESTAYNMPSALVLEGELDIKKVEKAFSELIKRHEVLRSIFLMEKGKPVQIVLNNVNVDINYIETEEAKLRTYAETFIKPFDLSKAPLLRVNLLKFAENKHLLLFDMHHIISDGVSIAILIREFNQLYEEKTLPPLKIQYKDYANWHNILMESEKVVEMREYWRSKLYNFTATNLPVINDSSNNEKAGKTLKLILEEEITEKINFFCNKYQITKGVFLLAVFKTLIMKTINQKDIIIGLPVAGRNHIELENIIGVFLNVLIVRSTFSDDEKFIQYLHQLNNNYMEALEYQDYPYEQLYEYAVETLKIQEKSLFSILYNYMPKEGNKTLNMEGIRVTAYPLQEPEVKYSLTLYVREIEEMIEMEAVFNHQVDQYSIENILFNIPIVIDEVIENDAILIEDLLSVQAYEEIATGFDLEFDNDDFF